MPTTAALPVPLQEKICKLSRRLRRRRWLRGMSLLLSLTLILFASFFLADAWFDFSHVLVRAALALFVGVAAMAALFGVVIPLCRPLDPDGLAAAIEQRYPELAERLTSTVQLARQQGIGHGSPVLIRGLIEEAGAQAQPLDFDGIVPLRPSARLLGAAGAVLVAVLSLSFLWGPLGEFGGRFFTSWFLPERLPYALQVTPGDGHAARGRPVTVTARLVAQRTSKKLPRTCSLVLAEAGKTPTRVAMKLDRTGDFWFTLDRLENTIDYHLEAGGLVTASYRLTAVAPVELAREGATITVTPPAYVQPAVHPERKLPAFGDVSVLQFSKLHVQLAFNRPAVSGKIFLTAKRDDGKGTTAKLPLPLNWSSTKTEADLALPALPAGAYTLTLEAEAEHGVMTTQALSNVTVWPDAPPAFTELPRNPGLAVVGDAVAETPSPSGHDQARTAATDDVLRLKVAVQDKEGIERVEVEYRVNDGPPRLETIVDGDGRTAASKEHLFRLKGKVKDGDLFFYRIRARDNRQIARGLFIDPQKRKLPETDLGPHTIHEPAKEGAQDRWFLIKIKQAADPLQQQEIFAQRDDVRRRLEAIKKDVEVEKAQLDKVRVAARPHPSLRPDQVRELTALGEHNQRIENALYHLARDVSRTEVLWVLATEVHRIGAEEMNRSGAALVRAGEHARDTDPRDRELGQADTELARALERLQKLLKLNDELAQDRLDQMKMEQLARRQEELAERVAQTDPKAQEELARLRAEQDRLADELRKLTERSKLFQKALEAAQGEHAQMLADQALALAKAQHALNEASEAAMAKERADKFAELARLQEKLAEKMAELARESAQAAKTISPLATEHSREASLALKKGQAQEALPRQDLSAQDLERLATDLIWSVVGPRSPREAARQLARLQAELQRKLEKLAADVARLPATELRKGLQEIAQAERAIQEAIKKLEVPPSQKELVAERQQAVEHAGQAAERMVGDTYNAFQKMDDARQALERLAQGLPEESQRPDLPKEGMDEQRRRKLADAARQLAKEQRELRSAVEKASADLGSSKSAAAQMSQQKDLRDQTGQLMKEFAQLAQKSATPGHGQEQANQAAQSLEQASSAMKRGLEQRDASAMQEAGREAAKMLDEAGQLAMQAAKEIAGSMKPGQPGAKTGQALQQGRMQMNRAQEQLAKGQPQDAKGAMLKAAQSIEQAAQQATEQMAHQGLVSTPRKGPADSGTGKHTLPDLRQFTNDMKQFTGKSWGELPGELRTRIVQDMRARYGDDYAAIIQRYFEAIADTKK